MKKGYTCTCNWSISRGKQTRKQYAEQKRAHAESCPALVKELEVSKKAAPVQRNKAS